MTATAQPQYSTCFEGDIEFHRVNFSYQYHTPTLKDISFKLTPGKTLAIVGPSGAGKSTIAMLALGFYPVDQGNITIGNTDMTELKMSSILENTGVIFQDTFLFDGTIRDNIRYCNLRTTDDEVFRAAGMAGIHEDIMKMPEGYDTDVAEGARLSGGQKQRIAIARALIKNPRMLLLDEATASLDAKTEKDILSTVKDHFSNVSTIMISHRLNLVSDADEILVLDQGRIVERGTHETLIQNGGLYSQLYDQ